MEYLLFFGMGFLIGIGLMIGRKTKPSVGDYTNVRCIVLEKLAEKHEAVFKGKLEVEKELQDKWYLERGYVATDWAEYMSAIKRNYPDFEDIGLHPIEMQPETFRATLYGGFEPIPFKLHIPKRLQSVTERAHFFGLITKYPKVDPLAYDTFKRSDRIKFSLDRTL